MTCMVTRNSYPLVNDMASYATISPPVHDPHIWVSLHLITMNNLEKTRNLQHSYLSHYASNIHYQGQSKCKQDNSTRMQPEKMVIMIGSTNSVVCFPKSKRKPTMPYHLTNCDHNTFVPVCVETSLLELFSLLAKVRKLAECLKCHAIQIYFYY